MDEGQHGDELVNADLVEDSPQRPPAKQVFRPRRIQPRPRQDWRFSASLLSFTGGGLLLIFVLVSFFLAMPFFIPFGRMVGILIFLSVVAILAVTSEDTITRVFAVLGVCASLLAGLMLFGISETSLYKLQKLSVDRDARESRKREARFESRREYRAEQQAKTEELAKEKSDYESQFEQARRNYEGSSRFRNEITELVNVGFSKTECAKLQSLACVFDEKTEMLRDKKFINSIWKQLSPRERAALHWLVSEQLQPVVGKAWVLPAVVVPDLEACEITGDSFVLPIAGGQISRSAIGGAGRYLVVFIPNDQRFVILDVPKMSVITQFRVTGSRPKFDAGMDCLVVYSRSKKRLFSFSLADGDLLAERKLDAGPLGFNSVSLGSTSRGPLVISDRQGSSTFFDPTTLEQVDLVSRGVPALGSSFTASRKDPAYFLPAVFGPYFLRTVDGDTSLHVTGTNNPIATSLRVSVRSRSKQDNARGRYFIPQAKVCVFVQAERIVFRAFDVEKLRVARGGEYLAVDSIPNPVAIPDEKYSYTINTISNSGGIQFTLEKGPTGATIERDGQIEWQVPAGHEDGVEEFVVQIENDAGAIAHRFGVHVITKLPPPRRL